MNKTIPVSSIARSPYIKARNMPSKIKNTQIIKSFQNIFSITDRLPVPTLKIHTSRERIENTIMTSPNIFITRSPILFSLCGGLKPPTVFQSNILVGFFRTSDTEHPHFKDQILKIQIYSFYNKLRFCYFFSFLGRNSI